MGNQNQNKLAKPFTEDEIIEALGKNRFPLEIRVLKAFHEAEFDPVIGHRFLSGEGEKSTSVEVDIMAQRMEELANDKGMVLLKAMVEAKQLVDPMVFVALKWQQPEPNEMRAMRIRFSARPTCLVLSKGPDGQDLDGPDLVHIMLDHPGWIATALDPLNEATVCTHWANVERHDKHGIFAHQHDTHKESFAKLIRVVTRLEEESALHFSQGSDAQLRVQLLSPTIVLGTPELYVYDAVSNSLEKTSSVIVRQTYDSGGRIHTRYVDVVTETVGLPQLIDRYRRAAKALRAACNKHVKALLDIAHKQSRSYQYERLAEANRPLQQGSGRDRVL